MKFRSQTKQSVEQFLTGLTIAVAASQLMVVWLLICGNSSASLATFAVMAAAGLVVASLISGLSMVVRVQLTALPVLACCLLAWCLPGLLDVLLAVSVSGLKWTSWLVFLLPGCLVMSNSVVLLQWLAGQKNFGNAEAERWFISGVGVGCLLPAVHGVVTFPMAISVTACLLVSTAARLWRERTVSEFHSGADHQRTASSVDGVWLLTAFGVGLATCSTVDSVALLMPIHPTLLMTAFACCVALLAALSKLGFVPDRRTAAFNMIMVVLWAAWPLISHRLINLNLMLNADVQLPWLLNVVRSFQLAVLWLPLLLMGIVSARQGGDHPLRPNWSVFPVAAVLCGISCGFLILSLDVRPAGLRIFAVLMLWLPNVNRLPFGRPSVAGFSQVMAGGLALLAAMTLQVDGVKCASLLFSSMSANSWRQGLEPDLILQSQGTRLLEQRTVDGQLMTVWKTSGDQLLIRRNGLPSGQLSSNTLTTPQPIAETLTTLLPLTVHHHAGSVLLLGDDSGAGLRVCCDFPLHTIHAVRRDRFVTDVAKRYAWASMPTSPEKDERVRLTHADAMVAARIPCESRYDVVIAASGNPNDLHVQTMLTAEFYRAAVEQLTDEGVFCQRISQHDLGSAFLLEVLATVRSQFSQVAVLQMSPGELAVIAGVSDKPLLDGRLLDRLSRDHVVRQLSLCGWDWSQVAALPVINTNDPVGIFEHQAEPACLLASSASHVFQLPFETARWADKAGELQQTFAPHQVRVADAGPRSAAYAEYGRRYSSVVQQSEILAAFPDNPWPYRKSLKMEMQRNPRPPKDVVQDGKIVQQADPEDERRRYYFEALGQLLTQASTGSVDPLLLQDFNRYTGRYEPLLSYFAHHELVRVHAATGHPSPALELRNRLHTVFFSEPGDLSVRLVSQAMEQILEDPELLTDDGQRFDYLNSMLQELVRRWERRRGFSPGSAAATQQDVDDCVRVANRALEAMQTWGRSVGMTDSQLLARRRFVNQKLISPLRDYREQVLVHRAKQHAAEDPDTADSDDGTGLPLLMDPAELMTN